MNHPIRNLLITLFFITLLIRTLTALTLQHAGYFDAFYYYHLALNMANGDGITQSVIWNYLDNPQELPRAGNQYWMPMANFMSWFGIIFFRKLLGAWRAAQLPFIVLSSLLPPFAAWLSWHEWKRYDWAISSALLTIFSSFYFVHWVVTDNFTPFALSVTFTLIAIWKGTSVSGGNGEWAKGRRWWVLAGVGAGLSHLSRVDGVLLVFLIAGLLMWRYLRGSEQNWSTFMRYSSAAALAYLLLIVPWWLRNWLVVGTAFPGGGTQTLWLRSYGEIFSYEPNLTLERYLAWGIGPILTSKLQSLRHTLLLVLSVGLFYMAPFILIQLPDAARRPIFRPFLLYAIMLLLTMPLVFTFPTMHGSLLHSAASLVPWMMVLVPPGTDRGIRWLAARRRSWNPEHASRILGTGFIGLAIIITLYVYAGNVWLAPQPNAVVASWNDRLIPFAEVEALLQKEGSPDERLFVGDPPAYYVTTGRSALVIPNEGAALLAEAAKTWNAPWFLLDHDNIRPYQAMYEEEKGEAGWQYVATFTDGLGKAMVLFHLENAD